MRQAHAVIFDLDDTLLLTSDKYRRIIDRLAALVASRCGIRKSAVAEIGHDNFLREKKLRERLRTGSVHRWDRFPVSWMRTFRILSARQGKIEETVFERIAKAPDGRVKALFESHLLTEENNRRIYEICLSLHAPPFKERAGAISAVRKLSSLGFDVWILTLGHETSKMQRKEFVLGRLPEVRRERFVVSGDKESAIRKILSAGGYSKENTVLVGDLPSDIFAASLCGIKTIYVPTRHSRKHGKLVSRPSARTTNLRKLPGLVSRLFRSG